MHRPSIRTIASAARVSSCTVSRALRGDTHLRPQTRERIQKLAREMGYELNAYVSSWMAHVRSTKTGVPLQGCLAYLNYHRTEFPLTTWDTPRRQFEGAVVRAHELGYRIEEIEVYRNGLSAERVRQILFARGIRGVLLPVSGDLADIDLPFDSLACVAIGHRVKRPAVHFTSADHHTMVLEACEKLAGLGYQRTGFVMDNSTDRRLEFRPSSAFLGWNQQLPKSRRIPPLFYGKNLQESELVDWCRCNGLDSLLCVGFDFSGFPLRKMLERHFRVPGEIALVSVDWHSSLGDVAGVDQRHELIGAAAVDIVIHMLNNNIYGIPETPRVTTVEGVWKPGATAPPRACFAAVNHSREKTISLNNVK